MARRIRRQAEAVRLAGERRMARRIRLVRQCVGVVALVLPALAMAMAVGAGVGWR